MLCHPCFHSHRLLPYTSCETYQISKVWRGSLTVGNFMATTRGPGLLQELYEESALTGGRDCCTWHTRPGRLERQHAPETRFCRALLAAAQAYILSQSLVFRFHYKTKHGQLPHRIAADPCPASSRPRGRVFSSQLPQTLRPSVWSFASLSTAHSRALVSSFGTSS